MKFCAFYYELYQKLNIMIFYFVAWCRFKHREHRDLIFKNKENTEI
jgi:hypothetical protein